MSDKPYPWYYTVNDRPVMIDRVEDGGIDCLVFDMTTGDFAPDRDYLTYTLPGSGKDVDQLTEDEFSAVVSRRSADVLRRWAEKLCATNRGTPAEIVAALGIGRDRETVARGSNVVELDPPPLGADKVMITGGEPSAANIDVRFTPGPLTRAHLDTVFGAGSAVPRVSATHPQSIAYEVRSGSGRCTVFGQFRQGSGPTDPVNAVVLRTERGAS